MYLNIKTDVVNVLERTKMEQEMIFFHILDLFLKKVAKLNVKPTTELFKKFKQNLMQHL